MSWGEELPPAALSAWNDGYRFGREGDSLRPIVGQPIASSVQNIVATDTLAFSDGGHTSAVTWLGTLTTTGDFTNASNVINNVANVSGYSVGAVIVATTLPSGTTVTAIDTVHNQLTVSNPSSSTVTGWPITITDPALTVGSSPNGSWSWALNLWADWGWPNYYTFVGGAVYGGTVTCAIQVVDGTSTVLTQASCSATFNVDNSNAHTTNMTWTVTPPVFGTELLSTFNGVRFVWTNSGTSLASALTSCSAFLRFKTGARLVP